MLISEVIKQLEQLKEKHGDCEVYCEESQDCYYEHHPVGNEGIEFISNECYEPGIYLSTKSSSR